jgi:hypothetical protein
LVITSVHKKNVTSLISITSNISLEIIYNHHPKGRIWLQEDYICSCEDEKKKDLGR